MRCNRMVILGWKSKKSMDKKLPLKILGSFAPNFDPNDSSYYRPPFIDHFEKCSGEIEANISVLYQGSYEGEPLFSDAGIDVKFKCKRCCYTYYPELPSSPEELNMFLTKIIKEI